MLLVIHANISEFVFLRKSLHLPPASTAQEGGRLTCIKSARFNVPWHSFERDGLFLEPGLHCEAPTCLCSGCHSSLYQNLLVLFSVFLTLQIALWSLPQWEAFLTRTGFFHRTVTLISNAQWLTFSHQTQVSACQFQSYSSEQHKSVSMKGE